MSIPWKYGDAADKAAKGSLSLVDALSKQKFATDAGREVIKAYNEAQDQSRKNSELGRRESLRAAEAALYGRAA